MGHRVGAERESGRVETSGMRGGCHAGGEVSISELGGWSSNDETPGHRYILCSRKVWPSCSPESSLDCYQMAESALVVRERGANGERQRGKGGHSTAELSGSRQAQTSVQTFLTSRWQQHWFTGIPWPVSVSWVGKIVETNGNIKMFLLEIRCQAFFILGFHSSNDSWHPQHN